MALTVAESSVTAAIRRKGETGEADCRIDLIRWPSLAKKLDAVYAEIVARHLGAEEKCDNCISTCCTAKVFNHILVDDEDVERLAETTGLSVSEVWAKYMQVRPEPGYTGEIRFAKHEELGELGCPFLQITPATEFKGAYGRCGVYEGRPNTCREYSASACDILIPRESLVRHKNQTPRPAEPYAKP